MASYKQKLLLNSTQMTTLNRQIETFIRESDMRATVNGRQLSSEDLSTLYNLGNRLSTILGNVQKATNIALLSYNIYLWRESSWNAKWIIPVATSGFICLRKTELYNRLTRWSLGWISGWNTLKTIRTGITQARNESMLEVISSASVMLGLSWRFSTITWLMCMPSAIGRGLYYGISVYGLNYILRADVQQRVMDFFVETLAGIDQDLGGVINRGASTHHTKQFEELVELKTYEDTEPQSCPICMQDDRTQIAQIKECQHSFCQECLREWYNKPVRVFNCPLCRINLDTPLDFTPLIRNTLTQLLR